METLPLGNKEVASEDDFEFRRHVTQGVPTLGERLDSLHEVRGARRIDNFNSSRGVTRGSSIADSGNSSGDPREQDEEQDEEQEESEEQDQDQGQEETRYNIATSMHVDDSSVKYLVPLEYVRDLDIPRDKLIKVINTESNISASQNERARNKRLSLSQRGRRLSMLSSGPDNKNVIVSPHKEVPEQEFYKHVGDVSFGKGLQVRQLFNWCSDRTFTRIQESERKRSSNANSKKDQLQHNVYDDPKKITMDIIKSFVKDLKNGVIDIDWEAEEEDEDSNGAQVDDSELRALFDDDDTGAANVRRNLGYYDEDEDYDVTLAIQPTRPELQSRKVINRSKGKNKRKRRAVAPQFKLPNTKNVENEKNLVMLKEKISRLEKEINDWAVTLDSYDPQQEWKAIREINVDAMSKEEETPMILDQHKIANSLLERLNCLSNNSHLLNSTSRVLLESLRLKVDKLSRVCSANEEIEKKSLDSRQLLRGLAHTL